MEEESVRSGLASSAFLYPPMEHFQPLDQGAGEAMRSLIMKCEALCGSDVDRMKLHMWLSAISGHAHFVFYGGAVYGVHRTTDLDVLSFDPRYALLHYASLGFVHIQNLSENHNGAAMPGLFLANTLLFPCTPDNETVARIESARRQVLSSPFFDGGIGELITHSAFKFACIKDSKLLTVRWRWTDTANMLTKTYTPHEINNQIRSRMQGMDDKDVRELTMAAMRRIRIKEERRAELSDRFIKELRQKKIHGAFG